ncbi:hypothetical protein F5Y13DRAFT_204404 [Hypoxylon sp. FL1857]|nr:hypothetical protein F5Y13DRAFT_204404 [Hypoxylon sp. FL1857]
MAGPSRTLGKMRAKTRARGASKTGTSRYNSRGRPIPTPGEISLDEHLATGGAIVEVESNEEDEEPIPFGAYGPEDEDGSDSPAPEPGRGSNHHSNSNSPVPGSSDNNNRSNGDSPASNSSDSSGYGDIRLPMRDEDDPDNPLLPGGRGRTLIGIEMEFYVAVTPRWAELEDPHPLDIRWQARNLGQEDSTSPRFRLTVRNMIVDILRRNGIIASKGADFNFERQQDWGWTSSLEDTESDRLEDAKNRKAVDWQGHYEWDPALDDRTNIENGTIQLCDQFIQFHANNQLELHETSDVVLHRVTASNVPKFITGPDGRDADGLIPIWFRHHMRARIEREQRIHEAREAGVIDPRSIHMPGSNPRYRAWTCTIDESLGAHCNDASAASYEIPDGSLPAVPRDDDGELLVEAVSGKTVTRETMLPPCLYKWFPGELVTPILDFNDPQTWADIRTACAALRDHLRIHKPMRIHSTGLHIHFGQENGWRLLQLKKLIALWMIMERSAEHLQPRYRSAEYDYALPLRKNSPLAVCLNNKRRDALSTVRDRSDELSSYYRHRVEQHVPVDRIPEDLMDFIREVWQYDTISGLARAMGAKAEYPYVAWRLSGQSLTDQVSETVTQTLEVRLMQGTLDADHIRRWANIFNRMIEFATNTNPEEFRAGIEQIFSRTRFPYDVLGIPREDMVWYGQQLDPETGYFTYPDRDRVNWSDPFMVPGHGATH